MDQQAVRRENAATIVTLAKIQRWKGRKKGNKRMWRGKEGGQKGKGREEEARGTRRRCYPGGNLDLGF